MPTAQPIDVDKLEKLKHETTVLIVDDENQIVRMLKKYFELEHYTVYAAPNAEEGYLYYQKNNPQIILADLEMPGASGIEFLDLIRTKDQTTEIIVITGHGSMEAAIEAMRRQASDFLTKPIDLDALQQAMDRSLKRLYKKRNISDTCVGLEKEINEISTTKERLEKIVRHTPNAVITYDKTGRIMSWNDEAVRITGFTQKEALGKLFSELFITAGPLIYADNDENDTVHRNVIGQLLTKDQQIRYFNRNASVLLAENGKPAGGIESFWDVTEQVNNDRLLEKRYLQVQTINEIGKIVASSTDLSEVMDFICQRLFQTFFESSQISIFLREDKKGRFVLKSLAGYNIDRVLKKYPLGTSFERDTGIICEAAKKAIRLLLTI